MASPGKPKRPPISGRGSKAKGSRYELALAAHMTQAVGLPITRAPLSGGGAATGGADLTGTPGLHVEAKRTERLNIREALIQAERTIAATQPNRDVPVVITRRNRETTGNSVVAMRLDAFLALYRAALTHNGYRLKEPA